MALDEIEGAGAEGAGAVMGLGVVAVVSAALTFSIAS
jgi:hypothetical protein